MKYTPKKSKSMCNIYNLQVSRNRTMFELHACQVAGFQNKRDIRHRSFIFTRTFTGPRDVPLTAAKFRLEWKISDQSMKC